MREESERYRRETLRRLKEMNRRPPPTEVLEAQKMVATFREKQAREREAIARLSSPLPDPELCRECYYLHARFSTLTPIPSEADADWFECPSCGHRQERFS
jgi:rubrerythrin